MTKTIRLNSSAARQRLDVFLAEKLKISRSQVQKMINLKQITVNDALPKKAGDTVKVGDKITILNKATSLQGQHPFPYPSPKGAEGEVTVTNSDRTLAPTVIAETSDYVVVDKPSGLLVHPTQANETNTLAAWLLKKYPGIKKVGDDPKVRPGIVHRLDKEASGLLVVARTQKMFIHLKNQFKNRTIEKEYLALVHGKVAKDWDEINFPIARAENAERMAARPLAKAKYVSTLAVKGTTESEEGEELAPGEKEARTEFFVEKRFVNFTLLRVIIHTGRMHQIRAHLLAYNHPLVGDPLYFQKKRKRTWDERLGRLFLHSTELGFTDLNGEKQNFHSPLPEKLHSFLEQLA